MTPSHRRKRQARQSRDGLWVFLAGGALSLCLIAGVMAQTVFGSPSRGAMPQPQEIGLSEVETRTGSILFVPFRGNQCQHNLFDNKTGAIMHSSAVACDLAFSKAGGEKSKGWSLARTEAIRGSFHWKKP